MMESTSNTGEASEANGDAPIKRGVCFTNRAELITAIDQYADQDCSNDGDVRLANSTVGR
jgi:hypothetical protein